jgi:2-keto-4-pentenoate hydratase
MTSIASGAMREVRAEDASVVAAADRLLAAYRTWQPCAPVRDLIGATDVDAAYAVQERNTRQWLAAGRRLVGRKIGLTAKSVQKQLGVSQPDFGMLFADMAVPDGEPVATERLLQPKVEGEIAFVLGRDLAELQPTVADVLAAVEYALPALEIVDSRVANWQIGITDTIADNASSGLYVLGAEPRALDAFDLRLCGMVLERRGEQVSVGAGAACLGHPLNAVLWLARELARTGRPLQAGDVVLSGALGPMVPVRPGDVFELRINGLGSVRAAFAPAAA